MNRYRLTSNRRVWQCAVAWTFSIALSITSTLTLAAVQR